MLLHIGQGTQEWGVGSPFAAYQGSSLALQRNDNLDQALCKQCNTFVFLNLACVRATLDTIMDMHCVCLMSNCHGRQARQILSEHATYYLSNSLPFMTASAVHLSGEPCLHKGGSFAAVEHSTTV